MYANESRGAKFPIESNYSYYETSDCLTENLAPAGPAMKWTANFLDGPSMYPEYWTDINIAICPSDQYEYVDLGFTNEFGVDLTTVLCSDASEDALGFGEPDNYVNGAKQSWAKRLGHSYWYINHVLDKGGMDDVPLFDWHAVSGNPCHEGILMPRQYRMYHMMHHFYPMIDGTPWPLSPGELVPGYQYRLDDNLSVDGMIARVGFGGNMRGWGNAGGDYLYQIREGVERFIVSDINNPAATAISQSEIAVMWDYTTTSMSRFSHVPGGSNVLYLDGHVSFMKYPGPFPVTKGWAQLIGVWNGKCG
jgi:prepilin-type processing-associated H-X9-DG protein